MCRRARAWLEARVEPGRLSFLACQSPDLVRVAPALNPEACMRAMQLVHPDGLIESGDRAIPSLLRMLRGWRWLAPVLSLPGMRWLSAPLYDWIARHRLSLSSLFFREAQVMGCQGQSCSLPDERKP
jgi:predicted DCC family thiol-disulfide oxidoreductase YuxK